MDTRFEFGALVTKVRRGVRARGTLALLGVLLAGCAAPAKTPSYAAAPRSPGEPEAVCAAARVETERQLAALGHCDVIAGDLVISNTRLAQLVSLPRLREVRGMLDISRNADLKSLGGLDSLTRIGKLAVHDNPRLTRLDGLADVLTIDHVLVARNPRLISLRALSSIVTAKSIEVRDNPMLQGNSQEFFPALERTERLIVENNASISPGERRVLMERVVIAPSHTLVLHVSR